MAAPLGERGDRLILVARGASRDLNPSLRQAVVDRAMERDPASYNQPVSARSGEATSRRLSVVKCSRLRSRVVLSFGRRSTACGTMGSLIPAGEALTVSPSLLPTTKMASRRSGLSWLRAPAALQSRRRRVRSLPETLKALSHRQKSTSSLRRPMAGGSLLARMGSSTRSSDQDRSALYLAFFAAF